MSLVSTRCFFYGRFAPSFGAHSVLVKGESPSGFRLALQFRETG